jgi:hypothetical protein
VKKSTKAALLSGLVFPGLGHLYLKRYGTGLSLVAGAAVIVGLLLVTVCRVVSEVLGRIQDGSAPPDVVAIQGLVSEALGRTGGWMDLATLVLVALWVIGIAGAYRAGVDQDKGEDSGTSPRA